MNYLIRFAATFALPICVLASTVEKGSESQTDKPAGNTWCRYALGEAGSSPRPARARIATAWYPHRYPHETHGELDGFRAATLVSYDDPNGKGHTSIMQLIDGLEPVGKARATDARLERLHVETEGPTQAIAVAPFPLKFNGRVQPDVFVFARIQGNQVSLHVPTTAEIIHPLVREELDREEHPDFETAHYRDFDLPSPDKTFHPHSVSLTACAEGKDECLRIWVATDHAIYSKDITLNQESFIDGWREFFTWDKVRETTVSQFKAVGPDSYVVVDAEAESRFVHYEGKKSTVLGTLPGYLISFDVAQVKNHLEVVAVVHDEGTNQLREWTSARPEFTLSSLQLSQDQKPLSVALALTPLESDLQWERWHQSASLNAGYLSMRQDTKAGKMVRRLLVTVRDGSEYGVVGAMESDQGPVWKTPRWYYIDRDRHPEVVINLLKARFDTDRIEKEIGPLNSLLERLYDRYRHLGYGDPFQFNAPEKYRGDFAAMIDAWYARLSYLRDVRFIPSGIRPQIRDEGFRGLDVELLVYQLLLWEEAEEHQRQGGFMLSQLTPTTWEEEFRSRLEQTSSPVWVNLSYSLHQIQTDLTKHRHELGIEAADDFDYETEFKRSTQMLFVIARQYLHRPVAPFIDEFLAFCRRKYPLEIPDAESEGYEGVPMWKALHAFLKTQDPLYDALNTEGLLKFFGRQP